jgi:hypothetical protein
MVRRQVVDEGRAAVVMDGPFLRSDCHEKVRRITRI